MSYIIKNISGEDLYASDGASDVGGALVDALKAGAYLRGAYLYGADLSGAYLRGAYLYGADLRGADLSGADLRGADLRVAYLRGADLSGADLRGADLSGANLRGADLSGANLSVADLSGANLTVADLSGAYLSGAYLRGAYLYGADLPGADLSGAYLSGAYLSGADLSGANLRGADLSGAQGINPYLGTPLLMLFDQPGPIRAYKLVNQHGEGPQYGGIVYEIGKTIEVADADCDPVVSCGAGLNVATLDWCLREWIEGCRILLVEFTAADIAAIPHGTNGKFRVHRLKVVGEKDLAELGMVPS